MTKYYIILINKLINTFSRVESSNQFDFSIKTDSETVYDQEINQGDFILASIEDNVYYNFEVITKDGNKLQLKKIFEIEKSINYKIEEEGVFTSLNNEDYNSICSSLFDNYVSNKIDKTELNSDPRNLKEGFANWLFSIGKYKRVYKDDIAILIQKLEEYENAYETDFGISIFDNSNFSIETIIEELKTNVIEDYGAIGVLNKKTVGNGSVKAILGSNNYVKYLKKILIEFSASVPEIENKKNDIEQIPFDLKDFKSHCELAGLMYSDQLITRYVSSLATKPFVLLSGLSGSGKTKLAQAFAQWLCESKEQYCIVPVGADWTNREPLLGYVNALENTEYILPENGALDLIIKANENQDKPCFLILDEMNLSHVERYFADFLSVMESEDKFKLHSSDAPLLGSSGVKVKKEYSWPKNLFVVGTVNIDETTYMFSPKVLDRANVIEFRVSKPDLEKYFDPEMKPLDMKKLWIENAKTGLGAKFGNNFVKKSIEKTNRKNLSPINDELLKFFEKLQEIGTEFGYRTASEIQTLFGMIDLINPDFDKGEEFSEIYPDNDNFKIDVAIMQKLLPKIHGSRRKLSKPLIVLAELCLKESTSNIFKEDGNINITTDKIKFPLSFYKIARMYKSAIENGFASYAEA
jgi:5-methylcytosine-specific restriction protein B